MTATTPATETHRPYPDSPIVKQLGRARVRGSVKLSMETSRNMAFLMLLKTGGEGGVVAQKPF